MGRLAADQVRGIVTALIDVDDDLARRVAGRDDDIDHLYRKIFADVIDLMRADPAAIEIGGWSGCCSCACTTARDRRWRRACFEPGVKIGSRRTAPAWTGPRCG